MSEKSNKVRGDHTLAYTAAGLDTLQAAKALLNRFAYGATPGQGEQVNQIGLGAWLQAQLAGDLPEPALPQHLANFAALQLSDVELIHQYPTSSQLSAHIRRFYPGVIPRRDEPVMDFSIVTAARDAFAEKHGFKSQDKDLRHQLLNQKVVRALYAQNQLREIMTDFWQNHFFTSAAAFNARVWLLPFERDALRPNALGSFRELLGAAVMHPALINFYRGSEASMQVSAQQTTLAYAIARSSDGDKLAAAVQREIEQVEYEEDLILPREFWPQRGPNQNLARALIVLQTLGPNGVASEQDIEAAARILTGWSTIPVGAGKPWFSEGFDRAYQAGFAKKGSFLFRADWHDAAAKRVLGLNFPSGGGLDEGDRLLDILAAHSDTARHISYKLAQHFVSETPSDAIVEHLASVFTESNGDIPTVLQAMVTHKEFWSGAAAGSKVKTPLHFTVSAVRSLGGELNAESRSASALVQWIGRMGQPLYAHQGPIGYPEQGSYWLDAAGMLNRVNFAQALVNNEIEGVRVPIDNNADSQQQVLALAGPAFQVR